VLSFSMPPPLAAEFPLKVEPNKGYMGAPLI
jgi:hypothetical protein